jgi:hypothetical protein
MIIAKKNEKVFILIEENHTDSSLKFIYSELLTAVHTVKSKGKISQNFVAFSEYMNFIWQLHKEDPYTYFLRIINILICYMVNFYKWI